VEAELARIDELVQQIERSTDADARDAARTMMRAVLDLHAQGLSRMLTLLRTSGQASETLGAWLGDDLVRSLLLLHDLHPDSLGERVERGLEAARGQLKAHGGDVELLKIRDGIVYLELHGNCHGCASSQATLQSTIEQTIYAFAPDVVGIEVEGVAPPSAVVPALVQLQ
jgi:Fe-S cluster biogenesis protein NfuA